MCTTFVHAQNDVSKQYNILFVLKMDGESIKTHLLMLDTKDIQKLDLPSKDSASKTLGPITEDGVVINTLKKNVTLCTLPMLLEKFNIDPNDKSLPIFIDGEAVTNPADIFSADDFIRTIVKDKGQIYITTKVPVHKGVLKHVPN